VDSQTVDLSEEEAVAALFTKLGPFDHLIFTAGDSPSGSIVLTTGVAGRRPHKGWAVAASVSGTIAGK
jgi:hypothetical protein